MANSFVDAVGKVDVISEAEVSFRLWLNQQLIINFLEYQKTVKDALQSSSYLSDGS